MRARVGGHLWLEGLCHRRVLAIVLRDHRHTAKDEDVEDSHTPPRA